LYIRVFYAVVVHAENKQDKLGTSVTSPA